MFWDCREVIVKQYVITVTIMQGSQNYFILIVTQCNSAACLRIFVCPSLSGDLVRLVHLVHLADCWQTLLLIQMLSKRYSWFDVVLSLPVSNWNQDSEKLIVGSKTAITTITFSWCTSAGSLIFGTVLTSKLLTLNNNAFNSWGTPCCTLLAKSPIREPSNQMDFPFTFC